MDVRQSVIPRRDTVLKAIERTRQRLMNVRSFRSELGGEYTNEEIEEEKRRLRMMEDFLEGLQ